MLKKMPNKFEFPGGKVEKNETLKELLSDKYIKEEIKLDDNYEPHFYVL